jgi:hypothetical protein
MATLNVSDVYGSASAAGSVFNPVTQVTGPNASSVTGSGQVGSVSQPSGPGTAFTWLGFVLALVLLRVALEAGGERR